MADNDDYHLEKFPPIRPRPESTAVMAASLSVSHLTSSASLCIAATTAPSTVSVASGVVTVTRSSAALPLSTVYSQVPVMVVNPMQHKKSSVAPVTLTTQSIQTCLSSNTTTTSSTSTNKPENSQVLEVAQGTNLVLGNPFPANSSSTNIMPGSFLPNAVFQSSQFPGNVLIAPFVQNGVLQGNIIQGNFPQSVGLAGGLVQINPQQFSFQNTPQISLTIPAPNPTVSVSTTTTSLGNATSSGKGTRRVREKSLPKAATSSSSSFQFVIEPDPVFNEKVKCARLEKNANEEGEVIPSTSDTAVPIVSRSASTDSNEYEEMTETEFLPKIEYCYSMKKLSLRRMMELLDKGQNVMLFVKPGTKDYYRAKVLCEAVVKHHVTGINADIKDEFYTSLISPYISLAEAMLLKKDIKTSLNINEEDENTSAIKTSLNINEEDDYINTIESSCETDDSDKKAPDAKSFTGERSETGNEAALSILKWKTEKLEFINPKLYQKYCGETKGDSARDENNSDENDVEFIREESIQKRAETDSKADGTMDKVNKCVGKEKQHVKEMFRETLSKQSDDLPENLNELVNKVVSKAYTGTKKKSEVGKADMIKKAFNKKSSEGFESKSEIPTTETEQIILENTDIPTVNRKNTHESLQIESDAELLREEYSKEVAKQKETENEAELLRNMYSKPVQNKNSKQSENVSILRHELVKQLEPTEPLNEAELIRKAFTLSKFNITETDNSCSKPEVDPDKTDKDAEATTSSNVSEDVIEILDDSVETDEQSLEIRLPDRFHLSKWRWTTLAGIQKFSDKESDEILKHCYLCGLKFKNASATWTHIINEHAKINGGTLFPSNFFCSHCYKTYSSMKAVRQHELDIHLSDFPCYFCGLSIDDRWDMLSHIASAHSLLYTCTHCHGQFLGSIEFKNHCKVEKHMQYTTIDESQIVTVMCLFCNVKFRTKQNLISHLNSVHIDTPIPNSGESVCSSCRHSFLDAQALFFHRNPDARRAEKLKQLSLASLNTLAVQGIIHKEKADVYRDRKKRMKSFQKGTHNTNNANFSKVEEYMRLKSDVDKFGYRELNIGSRQYKYPLQELLEYCEFGKKFPKEFATVVMDALIKLMIRDFPNLQVDKTTSDLQDLLVALSRSQKFTEILQKHHLKPLPWNGKIQACVKMFLSKVKAGCYKYSDCVPMTALVVSLQKSLNYLEDRRDSVVQKLRAKILENSESQQSPSANSLYAPGPNIRRITPTAKTSTISSLSTVNSTVQAGSSTSGSLHTAKPKAQVGPRTRSSLQVSPVTVGNLSTMNPNAQAGPSKIISVSAVNPNVVVVSSTIGNLPTTILDVKVDPSTAGTISTQNLNIKVGSSSIDNLTSIEPDIKVGQNQDFTAIWQDVKAQKPTAVSKGVNRKSSKKISQSSKPIPIAPKGGFSFILLQKKETVEENKRSAIALRIAENRRLKISKRKTVLNQMRNQSRKNTKNKIAGQKRQRALQTVRDMIARKRGVKVAPRGILSKENERKVEVRKRISKNNVENADAFNKNLRKRKASVKYTFEDILDESEEETTPSLTEESESEDEWKPSKVESEVESSESESSDSDDIADDVSESQSDENGDNFENESVINEVKDTVDNEIEHIETEKENEETTIRKVDEILYKYCNTDSLKVIPVIISNENLSENNAKPNVSKSKTENLDKCVNSEKLSRAVKESVVNLNVKTKVTSKERMNVPDMKCEDSSSITSNVQKRYASALVEELVPSKVLKVANSVEGLPCCTRTIPLLQTSVKCSFVKIERSDEADRLGLELISTSEDYTDRKLTRTFVKQICQEQSGITECVAPESDKNLYSRKEESNVIKTESDFGSMNTMKQKSSPKRGRGRPKKICHEDQVKNTEEEENEDSLRRKRGRPQITEDKITVNSDSVIALNDSNTTEVILPRKRGRPRKNVSDNFTGADCSTILDEVDTVKYESDRNDSNLRSYLQRERRNQNQDENMREIQLIDDMSQKEECSSLQLNKKKMIYVSNISKKEETLQETSKISITGKTNNLSDLSESQVEKTTKRKPGRPRKNENAMECSLSQFRTNENGNKSNRDPNEYEKNSQEAKKEFGELDTVNEDTNNSELAARKMLRPRKTHNYFEHDSSNNSSSEDEDILDFDEGIPQNLGSKTNLDNICDSINSNVVPKASLINVTNSEDAALPEDSNRNSDDTGKTDFVSTETKRMLSKIYTSPESGIKKEKVDEGYADSESQNKTTEDEGKKNAETSDRGKEVPAEVVKSTVTIKREKEDPGYAKAFVNMTETSAIQGPDTSDVNNVVSQPLKISDWSKQMLSKLAALAKKNQNRESTSVPVQQATLGQTWTLSSTGCKQSGSLITSATSSAVTSTSASTAAQVINPNHVFPIKAEAVEKTGKPQLPPGTASKKKGVSSPIPKMQPNTQVVRHPVYFYPGANSAAQSTSQAQQLSVNEQISSSSSLKLIPVSGTNKFILANIPTQQSGEVPPEIQAQLSHVRNQTSQIQQTQMVQQPQMIQQTHMMQQPQMIQQTQLMQQQQMIQQTQMMQQPQIQQTQMLQQPQMIQQTQMIQQPHMQHTQMIQQPQMMQQTLMMQQPQMIQQTQIMQQPQIIQQPQMIQHMSQMGQLQLTNIPVIAGVQVQVSAAQQSNQLLTTEMKADSDLKDETLKSYQFDSVKIKQEVNTDEQSTSEVQNSGPVDQLKVPSIQNSLPVQQNPTQNAMMQQVGQMQGLLPNQLQIVQPGQVQIPIQTGSLSNQFQGVNQSGQIMQGLQFCQSGVHQQFGQFQIGNVAQNQTQQTFPVIGSQGSTQTLMVNQQTPLAPGQLIYVPSSSQTGANTGLAGQIVNAGQAGNTTVTAQVGQLGNNSEQTGMNTAISGTVLTAEQASMVLQTGQILNTTGNNSVQTDSAQIGSNMIQGLQVVTPVQGHSGSSTVQTLQGQVTVQTMQGVASTTQNQITKENVTTKSSRLLLPKDVPESSVLSDCVAKQQSVSPTEQYKSPNMETELETPEMSVSTRWGNTSEDKLKEYEEANTTNSTKSNTKWALKTFQEWHREMYGNQLDTKTVSESQLAEILRKFYCGARPKDSATRRKNVGDNNAGSYHKKTLINIRCALNRHFADIGRNIDIIGGQMFKTANRTFNGYLKIMSFSGFPRLLMRKDNIEDCDLKKISNYFQDCAQSPLLLRKCVWYYLSMHYVNRGLEFPHKLKIDSFQFFTDNDGTEYAILNTETQQKNFQCDVTNKKPPIDPRMYATGAKNCPIHTLKLLIEKTDKSATSLFNNCIKEAIASPMKAALWYGTKPLAERTFRNFMGDLSRGAELSKWYTVHCLRATAIRIMSEGYVSRHKMFMSESRSEASSSGCTKTSSSAQKRIVSATLSKATYVDGSNSKVPETAESSVEDEKIVPVSTSSQGALLPIMNE